MAFGCLAPAIASAQEWYELYASGAQALRNNQPQRAADLLQRAIQKRPRPGISVPTYGTNFEPRYFPYLRLAEAYIRLEAFEDALKALEASARFGVEPLAERINLEGRARSALEAKEAKRTPASPVPPPAVGPPAAPPDEPPVAAGASSVTPGGVPTSPPVTDTPPVPSVSPPGPPVSPPPASALLPPHSPVGSASAEGSGPRPGPSGLRPSSNFPSPRSTEPVRIEATTLDITSAPPGADVFVDDELRGRTDPDTGRLRLTGLRTGRHRVRLFLQGHDDVRQDVDLSEGGALAFHGVLPVRPVPSVIPAPETPTGSRSFLSRRLMLGLGIGLLVVVLVAFWFKRQTADLMPSNRTPASAAHANVSGADTDEGLPTQFGDYRLIRRIGKGGMASVYEAERRGDRFALKRPLPGFLDDRTFLERFQREAELGRALHHPNIVRIFDRGQVGPVPYFAMELMSGETLQARLERDGRLDARLATAITAKVAEALDYAHHKGVIHRDLKPSNVMLERSGAVKVMDYGIARSIHLGGVTVTGSFVGTPHYAAPETVEAKTEPRSDLYSLGVVFFQMLTGELPFRGDNMLAVLNHHCHTPPPAPSSLNYTLSKELDRIVLRLLSKRPSDRPSAEDLLNELAGYLRTSDEAR